MSALRRPGGSGQCIHCDVDFTCECVSDGERRLYDVWGHDGSVTRCAYCDDCAALARIDWNGETASIVEVPRRYVGPVREDAA